MINFILDLFPFLVYNSKAFCEFEVGEIFQDNKLLYMLLERDAVKVKIVRWNWWTKLWWGGNIEHRSKATNGPEGA